MFIPAQTRKACLIQACFAVLFLSKLITVNFGFWDLGFFWLLSKEKSEIRRNIRFLKDYTLQGPHRDFQALKVDSGFACYAACPFLSPSSGYSKTHTLLFEHLTLTVVRKCFPMLCLHRLLQAPFSSHLRLRDIWEGCSEIMVTCCPNGIEPVNNLLGKTANTNIKTRKASKSAASPKCFSPFLQPLCKYVLLYHKNLCGTHLSTFVIDKKVPSLTICVVCDLQPMSMLDFIRLEHCIEILNTDNGFWTSKL